MPGGSGGIEVSVEGAEQLSRIAGAVTGAAPELRRALLKHIRGAVRPFIPKIREAARQDLPSRGGFADWMARSSFGVRTRTHGMSAGVRITGAKAGHDLVAIDRGRLRHPLFGNTQHWFNQSVKPGFFSLTLLDSRQEVQTAVLAAMDEFVASISRKASS